LGRISLFFTWKFVVGSCVFCIEFRWREALPPNPTSWPHLRHPGRVSRKNGTLIHWSMFGAMGASKSFLESVNLTKTRVRRRWSQGTGVGRKVLQPILTLTRPVSLNMMDAFKFDDSLRRYGPMILKHLHSIFTAFVSILKHLQSTLKHPEASRSIFKAS